MTPIKLFGLFSLVAIAVVIPIIVFVAQQNQTPHQPASNETIITSSPQATDLEQAINQFRQQNGIPPFRVDPLLEQSAENHNSTMDTCAQNSSVQSCFSHQVTQLNEPDFLTRIKQTGYKATLAGENIALGQTSASQVVQAWQVDASHSNAMLSTTWLDIGCGYLNGRGIFWTCDFAKSSGTQPTVTPTRVIPTSTSTQPTPTGTSGLIPEDIDHDGCVGLLDFNAWFKAIKGTPVPNTNPDVNNDGAIDILDFNLWFRAMKNLPSDKLC